MNSARHEATDEVRGRTGTDIGRTSPDDCTGRSQLLVDLYHSLMRQLDSTTSTISRSIEIKLDFLIGYFYWSEIAGANDRPTSQLLDLHQWIFFQPLKL